MRCFLDQAALDHLIDSHSVTAESIRGSTAATLHWLQSVRMHEGVRHDLVAARSVARSKANLIALALKEYAAWANWPAPTKEPDIDPDRYYLDARDRADRHEESCRIEQELYRSGDIRSVA